MDLAGCVNDARDWQALLESRGYQVKRLLDSEATRANIVQTLDALIAGASGGDSLVFTFSGHGSWLPDRNADEPDERDEMMCPCDITDDQFLLDDDLSQIFSRKPNDARLYVLADCCHSGSVVRYAADRPEDTSDAAPLKARFLPPYLFARGDRLFERAIDRVVGRPAPAKLRYAAVLFSGCQDTEFSYDTAFANRPNGAFTRTAIDALKDRSIATPKALFDAIRRTLPSARFPQTPQLLGSRTDMTGPLF
jgi:hypothetical protein